MTCRLHDTMFPVMEAQTKHMAVALLLTLSFLAMVMICRLLRGYITRQASWVAEMVLPLGLFI